MHVLWCELRQPHATKSGEDVQADEVLITAKCHWTSPLLSNLREPAVHVLANRQPFVHHRPTFGDVPLDLGQTLGHLASRLTVNPLAAVVVQDDRCRPTSIRSLQDRAFAVAAASRA